LDRLRAEHQARGEDAGRHAHGRGQKAAGSPAA
jgi:hypothetical protein